MALNLKINGQPRGFEDLSTGDSLEKLIYVLQLKGDRIAVERNGEIVPRTTWQSVTIADGDHLEVVHFVGGGALRTGKPGS